MNAAYATLYLLDHHEKVLFSARPQKTASGEVQEHFHLIHGIAGEVCTTGKVVRLDLDACKVRSHSEHCHDLFVDVAPLRAL